MGADHRGKLEDKKPKHIPIHLVSFGHFAPYLEDMLHLNNQANTYTQAWGADDLSDALKNGKTNVVLLNVDPADYERFLVEKAAEIEACKPLLVAPDHHSEDVPKSVIAKYNIKFVPMGLVDRRMSEMPAEIEALLQQRTTGHGGPGAG